VTSKRAAKSDAILSALRAKSPQSPRALAKTLKLASTSALHYQLKPLIKSGAVVVSGTTNDRQVSLPGRAKEVP